MVVMNPGHTTKLNDLLTLLRQGDTDAVRTELIEHSCQRLRLLAAKMLNRYPMVRRWEQTDDVFVELATRLHQTLEDVRPESARHFYNLAGQKVRWVLIEMARRHYGPLGVGRNHDTGEQAETSSQPRNVSEWVAFHEAVENLPDEAREVFNLTWYEGLSQDEIGEVLGLSVRTVKRRWQAARCQLYEALDGEPPS
ncbi:RNA polymerase sigma factor [Stieleria bergensis]|uniref:RNA polymerase sigma factor n=2 Tax=Stieleria bergensis TaxID=2528025 RepID=A0A517STG7_9BACT|nr:RNA polymerase sigma factor [Planctomycetes bacterium SV_7m_r]